jgi:hypothetical protein
MKHPVRKEIAIADINPDIWAVWREAMKMTIDDIDLELHKRGFLEGGDKSSAEYEASPWFNVGLLINMIEKRFPELKRKAGEDRENDEEWELQYKDFIAMADYLADEKARIRQRTIDGKVQFD